MSNSQAFPIAHLESADAVRRLVDRLLTVAGAPSTDVEVRILTDSHEAARYSPLFPRPVLSARLSPEVARQVSERILSRPDIADGLIPGEHHSTLIERATPALLEMLRALPAAPTEVRAVDLSADDMSAPVLAALGAARASVIWDLPGWPAVDELALPGQFKHASIQVNLNSTDIDALEPAHGHLVYLHVGPWPDEQARASWLARQVGCEILGPSEHGW